VISNDSDLAEPIQVVRKEFGIPVVVVQPCRARRRRSVMLQRVALKSFDVQDAWLQASQFPPTLTDRHGTITRQASW